MVLYDLNDANYNKGRNLGSKGKEILAHELGHLRDKKDYSNYSDIQREYAREKRAIIYGAKLANMGSADYKRHSQDIHNRELKDLLQSSEYKALPIEQRIQLKHYVLTDAPHAKSRKFTNQNWKRLRRLGLRESYIGYLLNLNIRRLSCKG